MKDRCNCCDICAAAPAQLCGGPWRGTCSAGYFCKLEESSGDQTLGSCIGKVLILKALFKFVLAELHLCCIVSDMKLNGQFLVK